MSKVLVTGGAGFIGSHITDHLIQKGYEVVVVDNLSTGSVKNINSQAKFHREDICNREGLERIFESGRPDYVIHEAAQINVRTSMSDPALDARINILGSVNLLECCREYGVKKVIYASSGGAIYGEPVHMPADEKHQIMPLSPYGASKYSVENYLYIYKVNYGLESVSLRYANVYGPRQDPFGEAGVIAIFTKRLLSGETPVIFGDGDQTRDFVYVGDVARANILALEKTTINPAYNIGVGKETSVNELYDKINDQLSTGITAIHGEAIPGEVRHIYLDIGLAAKDLGWTPETDINEGIKKTVEWFREEDGSR